MTGTVVQENAPTLAGAGATGAGECRSGGRDRLRRGVAGALLALLWAVSSSSCATLERITRSEPTRIELTVFVDGTCALEMPDIGLKSLRGGPMNAQGYRIDCFDLEAASHPIGSAYLDVLIRSDRDLLVEYPDVYFGKSIGLYQADAPLVLDVSGYREKAELSGSYSVGELDFSYAIQFRVSLASGSQPPLSPLKRYIGFYTPSCGANLHSTDDEGTIRISSREETARTGVYARIEAWVEPHPQNCWV